jgi:tRNA modification GTPase
VVDEVLVAHFPAPRSYTGEEVGEIHTHGSPILLERVVEELVASGARPARPGEFTERAFLAGKLDLSQAEGVQELVASRSREAAGVARRLLAGELGARIHALQEGVVAVQAEVEAAIDFVDEEVDPATGDALLRPLDGLLDGVDRLLAGYATGRRLLEGARVVLVGATNAGKSSIFNGLLSEERAIVTAEEGTTRDYLEVEVEWEGMGIHLVDTAGLREAGSAAEAAGIQRSRGEVERADLLLHVVDASRPAAGLGEAELPEVPRLLLWNKIDLEGARSPEVRPCGVHVAPVSARTGAGLDGVRAWIVQRAGAGDAAGDEGLACLPRHHDALRRARAALAAARREVAQGSSPELIAFELHEAQEALGEVVSGRGSEAVLEAIFRRFCIGK